MNTVGSYTCLCASGYNLIARQFCTGKISDTTILLMAFILKRY